MSSFAARLLYWIVAALGQLPWSWLNRAGDGIAALWRRLDAREARVARRNLELAYPQLGDGERQQLQRTILATTARQTLETLRFWTRPRARNLALIREQHGVELFDAALASGRGLIVAAPHHGNWELLNQWLASRTPLAILYRPPESAIGEAFLQRVRADDAGRVTQVRADGSAVRQLLKLLKAGGVVGILPDQQPKAGDGEFAPFFGVPALTMTLLPRLAARTDAVVLFAWCERIGADPGSSAPLFALHIEPAPVDLSAPDPVTGVHALNAAVEAIARRDPTQYQWTYKRYTLRPPGSGERNPYRDLERH
jgi:Kdo2-lipid IVA lauroyltransferase/acyltransferase